MSKPVDQLNQRDKNLRLLFLSHMMEYGEIEISDTKEEVNNHIHTTYSFSPYSPTLAIVMAYTSGLVTAGIMDHDSIGGAEEFIKAGELVGLATTIGVECRVSMAGTPLEGRRINNPDQKSIAYMALHGIPHTQIGRIREFFAPYIDARLVRDKKMVDNINELFRPYGIELDFVRDVLPISEYSNGGTVTERHILFALSKKIVEKCGKGKSCVDFIKNTLEIPVSQKVEELLLDEQQIHYEYDLLGVLKSDLVGKIYVDATDECPPVREVIALAKETSSIAAYAYLGDVGSSVTGDKKAQKFEDDYLDLLFETIDDLGYDAVTYMPSRNTLEQLERVMTLCDRYGMFQISGEDINTPRQKFLSPKLQEPEFRHLIDSTWALIGHEKMATKDLSLGMFSEQSKAKYPNLKKRILAYREYGLKK